MTILYFLIPLSICMAGIALFSFIWSVNNGQFDDLESAPQEVAYEDIIAFTKEKNQQ